MSRNMFVRRGENLRQAEIRWQERNDPRMRDRFARGETKGSIAARFGISKTAVLNALRRQAKRDSATHAKPESQSVQDSRVSHLTSKGEPRP